MAIPVIIPTLSSYDEPDKCPECNKEQEFKLVCAFCKHVYDVGDAFKPNSKPDNEIRCVSCLTALTTVEQYEYINRCMFCGNPYRTISLWKFLHLCYLDYRIYKLKHKLFNKYKVDSTHFWKAILGNLGHSHISEVQEYGQKKRLIKAIVETLKEEE